MGITFTFEPEQYELVIYMLDACEHALNDSLKEKKNLVTMAEVVLEISNKLNPNHEVTETEQKAIEFLPTAKENIKEETQKLTQLRELLRVFSPERELQLNME